MGAGDSKLPTGSITRLGKEQIAANDVSLWGSLMSTSYDAYQHLGADQIRQALKAQPRNIANLCRHLVATLEKGAQSAGTPTPAEAQKLLTCAALLTRVLPVLFEEDAKTHFVETVFWQGQMPAGAPGAPAEETAPFPLSGRLMDAAIALLFRQGFTIAGDKERANGWYGGMASANTATKNRTHDTARVEMLKLVLISCSQTLFVTPDEYKHATNKWLLHYTAMPKERAALLLQSLCAVIFSYDPVGVGVPYASQVMVDTREVAVDMAVQCLITWLDYVDPARAPKPSEGGKAQGVATEQVLESVVLAAPTGETGNSMRDALRELSSEEDFDFIFQGLCRLLNNPHQANNTLLPGAMKQIACFQELLILFWKMIDENKDFLSYILRAGDINELVVPMLYFMYEGRKDPSKLGLIHICTFILLLLSGERNFCVNLNAAFSKKLPVDLPPFNGNHADLLYIVIHKLMTDGPQKLDTLYDCFMTTMSNVSPYIKTFCMPAALRLGNLFEMFGSKKRLLAHEQYPRYLVFCIEVFNNVIQYQYEGNPHFIYQILRRKKVFSELQELMENGAAAADLPAAPGGDVDKFVPTQEWVKSWASSLPLQPCMRIMQHLLPQLEQFCTTGNVNDENVVVDFLKTTTMVGLLPVPHPILIRKYQQNEFTSLWFTTYIWGVIYLRNQVPAFFDAAYIRLFTISYIDG